MISIKTDKEIEIMAKNGKMLAKIMKELAAMAAPGITTNEINKAAEGLIFKYKGIPSFKGYNGFPAALCCSINDQIVHTPPSDKVLKEGDILSLDLGMEYNGYHSDMAITVPIGEVSSEALHLIRATRKALKRGIKKVRPGIRLGDISNTIQRHLEGQGLGIVRDLCGHGIGKKLHEDPQILNYGKRNKGIKVEKGMVFCLEPMATMGGEKIKKEEDGFTFATQDGSLSAHFEHMMVVTERGCRVLTSLE
ncbi:type I methionyl aminopeptidase [Candidatus Parcubacteria bacterium]|nr:type I methionyl aminopeptidase [Candidatus Parcubacteria bacterium]